MAMLADIHSRSYRVWGSSDPEQLYVYMGSRANEPAPPKILASWKVQSIGENGLQ
ncbi:hypothetical protein TrispH2_003821 [Trichoplax sp. H2]|nr:hypothetical protein TrispH2_003821 [Trichoplax sp. H2]|eukprot:RDD44102.1 hypothetical protein TrispH2_003821 [Trichoplax sp. H2]